MQNNLSNKKYLLTESELFTNYYYCNNLVLYMPNIIEIKTGNTLFGVSETEAIALINSKRYVMEGELVNVTTDVAIEIIEQERKKIIEEREELERQKTDLYIKRENLKIERKQFEQEKKKSNK